jgi:ribosome-associated heat shock protein Hsp15
MRIDKFLWAVRFYKTRSLATDACKKHKISINGQPAKPSKEVFPGDKITVRKNQIDYRLLVLNLPDKRLGAKLVPLYIKDMTPPEAFEHLRLMRDAHLYYRRKGLGRPTKKDRRQLDEFFGRDSDENTDKDSEEI